MANHFYLSCARFDGDRQYVSRFFEDLSECIRIRLGLRKNEPVGFYDPVSNDSGSEWFGERGEALRMSRTLVCLTSPAFFRSGRCGREWQVFQSRLDEQERSLPLRAPSTIVPVNWIATKHLPHNVLRAFDSVYGQRYLELADEGVLDLWQGGDRRKYARLIDFLSRYISAASIEVDLSPLEVLPIERDVSSFFNWREALPDRQGNDIGDKYKALIIDDDDQIRNIIVEVSRLAEFEAEGYDEAEIALNEVFRDPLGLRRPDVVVVDLELKPGKLQGMDVIVKLAERDIPSAVLAISGDQPTSLLRAYEAGAFDTAVKPLDVQILTTKMKYCAGIGRKRRVHKDRQTTGLTDSERRHRPVFLSYSKYQEHTAYGIKAQIEARGISVWYAPTTVQPGDEWHGGLRVGIDQAQVFVALISDNYISSAFCLGEFNRFHDRMQAARPDELLLLPILYGDPEAILGDASIGAVIRRYQYIHLTSERVVDAYSLALLRVEQAVQKNRIDS